MLTAAADVPPPEDCEPIKVARHLGVNVAPGSADDGWPPPKAVALPDGSTARLHKDGQGLQAAYRAIRRATKHVCLESYIFANDATGQAFARLLGEKARAGVLVHVIYDSFGSFGLTPLTRFWQPPPAMFGQMRQAGVRLREFHPLAPWRTRFGWRPWNRDHRKLICVDGEWAWLGGLNIGQEYAGPWIAGDAPFAAAGLQPPRREGPPSNLFASAGRHVGSNGPRRPDPRSATTHRDALTVGSGVVFPRAVQAPCEPWRDTSVTLSGPAARTFVDAFACSWNYCVHGGRIASAQLMRPGGDVGIVASVPMVRSPLRPLMRDLIDGARHDFWLTMAYFAPDDELLASIERAARRGVRVRLMLPGRSDVRALLAAARAAYGRLLAAGVEIHERQGVVLHAKTLVVDSWLVVIGSTNLDHRSVEFNCELSAIIRSPELGQQMETLFENDVRHSRQIDPNQWQARPFRDRFVQGFVSRLRHWL